MTFQIFFLSSKVFCYLFLIHAELQHKMKMKLPLVRISRNAISLQVQPESTMKITIHLHVTDSVVIQFSCCEVEEITSTVKE